MTRIAPRTLLAWSLCLLVVLLASVFGRPDIPIDETRYISVAWEAWSRGDWLVMHSNGVPYHHKPPLLFWLIGLGWSVLGVNDWWPRAVSALFSLLSVVSTAAIARRLWPDQPRIPPAAGWFVLSGAFWMFFSSAIMFDVMLTACTLLALLGVLRAWQQGGRAGWVLCGIGIGLGILAKGPVALLFILPVALARPWWGGYQAHHRGWYRGVLLAFLIGAAIALAWAIPAAWRGGAEFRNAIFWGQTAGRISGSLAHRKSDWFYFLAVPLIGFPLFFWGRAWSGLVGELRSRRDTGVRFLLWWILPAFAVLSAAGGKQIHYILPLFPAFALLLAMLWSRSGDPAGGRRWAVPLLVALLGVALIVVPHWLGKSWLAPYAGSDWRVGGALLLLLAIGALGVDRWRGATPAGLGLLTTALVSVLFLFVVRPLGPVFDMKPMAARLQRLEVQGVVVAHASAYNDQYGYYGRLRRPLVEIGRDEILPWLTQHPEGRVVAYLKHESDLGSIRPVFSQPYLNGVVVLLDIDSARRMAAR